MASEEVIDVVVQRHMFNTDRPFQAALDGILGGISQPDIGALFAKLAASESYEEFSSLVFRAQGSVGLIRFLQFDLDTALADDLQARHRAGRRLVRLIAGNPVTLGQMARHVPDERFLRTGHHPDRRTTRPRNPSRLRHRVQRDRALR